MSNNQEYENEEIITLMGESGEEMTFINIAGIALESGFYMILQPTELLEGMADDEALVFQVKSDEANENEKFDLVLDNQILDAVFAEYERLLDEAEED